MNEITRVVELVPSLESTPNQEYERIITDFKVSDVLKEIGRYRIWRLHKTGSWRQIVDNNGNALYNSWEEIVNDLAQTLDCGRQQIYDRVRVYEQLHWLGYTDQESIQMVADHPYLYTRTLDMVVDWNQREEQPRRILIPQMANATEEQAKTHLRELLTDVKTFDTQKDALKFVSESVLAEPQVDFWYDGDVIRCTYFEQSIDEAGNLHTDSVGTVTFYPDNDLPAWARTKLEKMFKSIGRYKTT